MAAKKKANKLGRRKPSRVGATAITIWIHKGKVRKAKSNLKAAFDNSDFTNFNDFYIQLLRDGCKANDIDPEF